MASTVIARLRHSERVLSSGVIAHHNGRTAYCLRKTRDIRFIRWSVDAVTWLRNGQPAQLSQRAGYVMARHLRAPAHHEVGVVKRLSGRASRRGSFGFGFFG